jgi:hypothetical protein
MLGADNLAVQAAGIGLCVSNEDGVVSPLDVAKKEGGSIAKFIHKTRIFLCILYIQFAISADSQLRQSQYWPGV